MFRSVIIVFFSVSILISCKTGSAYLKIENEYSTADLVGPVACLDLLLLSTDYFDRFFYTENNDFARIFYEYSVLKTLNFSENQSIKLRVSDYLNDQIYHLKTMYRGIDEEDNQLWLFSIDMRGGKQLFEMKNHSAGIPLSFRFLDRDSGEYYEKIPESALVFQNELKQIGEESFLEILDAGKDTLYLRKLEDLFHNPVNLGVEMLETDIGRIAAVHFYDSIDGKGEVDYWINHHVPGSIVKIVYRDAQGAVISEIEIVEINNNDKAEIPPLSQFEQPPYARGVPGLNSEAISEGSLEEPMAIHSGITHYGSVSHRGVSYYSIPVDRLSQVEIEVNNIYGSMELKYYGDDDSFTRTVSPDGTVAYENSNFYFSVTDKDDQYTKGEFYEIDINLNPMLNRVAVSKLDQIHMEAGELAAGKEYWFNISDSSLNYFKTSVDEYSNIEVALFDPDRRGRLFWYDIQNGQFLNAEYFYKNDQHFLTIRGISAGATCYYYYCLPSYKNYALSDIRIEVDYIE